jgi:DNA polymerase I-like protein with 3'-5' exonuclease and polymerase domains
MIEDFYRTYPRFRLLNENTKERAEAVREIKMWTGRARHFKYRSDGYKAMNSLIQGGAADIVERIMVRCYELLDSDDCRMLLQVHDSITWEVRKERVEEMMPKIKAVMEDVEAVTAPYGVQLDVKFAVDCGFWTEREAARLELAA